MLSPFKVPCNAVLIVAFSASFLSMDATAQNSSCSTDKENTSYYRRLAAIESMAEAIVGIEAVTKEQALNLAHFRVVRDGCGALKNVGYYYGDRLKPIDENFTGNSFTPSSQTVFEYEGAHTTIRFLDHVSNSAKAGQNASSYTVTRDSQGRPIEFAFHDDNNTLTIGPPGYALAKWNWLSDGGGVETHFDANEEEIVSGGAFKFSSANLMFGEHGLLSEIKLSDDSLNVAFKRHKDGSLRSWRAFDATGGATSAGSARVHGVNYAYDDNGYLVRLKYLNEDGQPTLSAFGHMGFARDYREDGNRLSYNFANAEGKIWAPPQRGYAGQNYQWREDGLVRVRTEYVDTNGVLIDHPQRNYAVILYEFDDNDRVSRRLFLDSMETPLFAQTP